MRLIGDVHAQVDFVIQEKTNQVSYLEIIRDCRYSVQVGDMGDATAYGILKNKVNPDRHRFVPGNHDDYDNLPPHALGDFGVQEIGGIPFFFVRGAKSNDMEKRLELQKHVPHQLWWKEEELSEQQILSAIEAYNAAKPEFVVSHACPAQIRNWVISDLPHGRGRVEQESRTHKMLQTMYEIHQPELWCFGHYHHDWAYQDLKTDFRCIGELSYIELDESGNILQ